MKSAVSGVSSAGFSTTVQPAANAGASFQAIIRVGKFHGMIAPTTPTGTGLAKAKNLPSGLNGTEGLQRTALQLRGHAGHEPEAVDRTGDIDGLGDGHVLAVVDRLEFGQGIDMLLHQVSQAVDQALAHRWFHVAPGRVLEGTASRGDRAIDIGGIAFGHPRDLETGRGIEHRQGFFRCGSHPLAADQIAVTGTKKLAGGRTDGIEIVHCYGHCRYLQSVIGEHGALPAP